MINEPDERHHPRQDEADSVRVRVLFFGAARDAATDEAVLSLARASTARDAFERVLAVYPDLRRFRSSLLVAVNQEYAQLSTVLKDGDEVAMLPPVSGGADSVATSSSKTTPSGVERNTACSIASNFLKRVSETTR